MRKALVLVLMLMLTGCVTLPAGGQIDQPTPSEEPTASHRSITTENPLPPAETPPLKGKISLPVGAVIMYRRSGGTAGVNEQWTIYDDGRITFVDESNSKGKTQEWQVPPEEVESLLAKIKALGFFDLKGNYLPLDTCCDRFTHQVIVRSGDNKNSVTTLDAAPGVPPEVWRVIDEINSLAQRSPSSQNSIPWVMS